MKLNFQYSLLGCSNFGKVFSTSLRKSELLFVLDDKLYTSLSANTIMAKVTNHFQRTKLITSSTDKHYSLDSEDDFRSGCRTADRLAQ